MPKRITDERDRKTTISISMSIKTIELINKLACDLGASRSYVITEAVERFADYVEDGSGYPITLLDREGRVIGEFDSREAADEYLRKIEEDRDAEIH